MKNLIRIVLLLTLLSNVSIRIFGQDQRKADSLMQVLENDNLTYDVQIRLLRELSFNLTDPKESLSVAIQMIRLANSSDDHINLYRGYYLKGLAYDLMGKFEQAIEAYFRAAKEAEYSDYNVGLVEVYLTLGDVYSNQKSHSNSVGFYNKALNLSELIIRDRGDTLNHAGILANLGYEFYRVSNFDSALFYLESGRKLFSEIKYSIGNLYCEGNIGLVHAKQGQFDVAEKEMQHAINGLLIHQDFYAISDFTKSIADIYLNRGDLDKALFRALESLEMAEKNNLLIQARDASHTLYRIYMALDDPANAVVFLNRYYSLKDSINNEESIQKIADLRTEYEVGQKQAEVDVLTAQQKTERVVMAAIAVLAVVLLILGLIVYKYYKQKSRINQELERLNQTKDKFFSIISHDLRGPVSSFMGISRMIKFMVQAKETDQLLEVADDIDESVERLSALLDNLLNWAMQQQGHFPNVPEKIHLKEMSEDLVKTLENMARGKNITLTTKIDQPIQLWADKNTTMTILRNLVNNALKFTPEGGQVTITAEENGAFAEIKVSDTGVGIPADKLNTLFKLQDKKSTYGTSGEKGLGLGLQLVYEFIEMNSGEIEVESKEGEGTTFRVSLPLFAATDTKEFVGY